MNENERKEFINLVKKSGEEIGNQYETLSKEIDADLKKVLTEEEYNVWVAINSNEYEEQELINKIGKEKYNQILDKISDEMKKIK